MGGVSEFFSKHILFSTSVKGNIYGSDFVTEGNGVGNSTVGHLKGKWVCKCGKLPMAWAALAKTFGYSVKYVK